MSACLWDDDFDCSRIYNYHIIIIQVSRDVHIPQSHPKATKQEGKKEVL